MGKHSLPLLVRESLPMGNVGRKRVGQINRVYQGLWYTARSKTKGANRNATLRN